MFCKWCGMESATTDVCSWCRHVLTEAAPKVDEKKSSDEPKAISEPPHVGTGEIGLAAGVAASDSTPDAGIQEQTVAPVALTSTAVTSGAEGRRPIIGIKRPGGGSNPPPLAPILPRSPGTGNLGGNNTAPPPRQPLSAKPAPSASPTTPVNRDTPPSSGQSTPNHSVSNTSVSSNSGSNHSAPVPISRMAPPPTAPIVPRRAEVKAEQARTVSQAPAHSPSGELEGGLAAGQSAPSRQSGNTATMEPPSPQLGTFEAQNSKYYSGQVIDPVSGTHYDAATGKVTAPANPNEQRRVDSISLNWDEPQPKGGVGVYAGALVGILVVLLAAVFISGNVLIPLLLANLAGGALLPILRVGPWHDEDSDDALIFLFVTLIFGPFVTAIVYGVLSAIRGGGNPSVLGLTVVALTTRVTAELASGSGANWRGLISHWKGGESGFNFMGVLVSWAGIAALVGWILANAFHKADD